MDSIRYFMILSNKTLKRNNEIRIRIYPFDIYIKLNTYTNTYIYISILFEYKYG
jgi:hypothetical protein